MYYFMAIRDYEPVVKIVGDTKGEVALEAWSRFISKRLEKDLHTQDEERQVENAAGSGDFSEALELYCKYRFAASNIFIYHGEIENLSAKEDDGPEEKVFQVTEDVDLLKSNPNFIIADFNRQEWTGSDDQTLRTIETQYWDVTARIEEMDEETVKSLTDNDYSTDQLIKSYSDHDGPHSVYVTDQIQDYWRHTKGGPLWE